MTGDPIPQPNVMQRFRSSNRKASDLTCGLRLMTLLTVLTLTVAIVINRDKFTEIAALGYIGAFLVMLLSNATLILPAPGLIFVFALGASLNPLIVGACAAAGAALGELTGYITGYGGLFVLEDTRILKRITRWMDAHGSWTIFVLSAVPNPFFDVAGFLAGTGRMSVVRFLSLSFAGKLIQATLVSLAGALSIDSVEQWLSLT